MTSACYERKIGEVLMACGDNTKASSLQLPTEYSELQLTRDSVLNVAAAVASTATNLTPVLSSLSPVGLPTPLPSGSTGSTIFPGSVSAFKDYSQPLHVDCSVEYELPSQAKPPPGNAEPLLMIHPCYYRLAEREKRTMFVNNLPSRNNLSSSSSSSLRQSSRSSRNVALLIPQTSTVNSLGGAISGPSNQHNLSGLTGMMVNPMMPIAAPTIAASTQKHQKPRQHQKSLVPASAPVAIVAPMHANNHNGNPILLPSPSLPSMVASTSDVQNSPAAVAAANYHAALTAAIGTKTHHPEAKQQHSKFQTTTELGEKVLSAVGLYPQYFRSVQRQQPQAQQQQQTQQQTQSHHRHSNYHHQHHQHHQHQQTHHNHHHQPQQHHHQQLQQINTSSTAILNQVYPSQRNQHQQQQQQKAQSSSYGMAMMVAPTQRHHHQQTMVGSTATPTILGHHPYRRTSASTQSRSNLKHSNVTTATASSSLVSSSASSGSSTSSITSGGGGSLSSALPTGSAAATSYMAATATAANMSNIYANVIHRHHHHHHHHHAINTLPTAHSGFYDAPVYHALIPQS